MTVPSRRSQAALLGQVRREMAQGLEGTGIAGAAWSLLTGSFTQPLLPEELRPTTLPVVIRDPGQDERADRLRIGFLLDPDDPQHSGVRSIEVRMQSSEVELPPGVLSLTSDDYGYVRWYAACLETGRNRGVLPNLSPNLLFISMGAQEPAN